MMINDNKEDLKCHNPNVGLTTKAKAYKGASQK